MTEAEFYSRVDEFLEYILEENPVLATQLGLHRWDDKLSDNRLEALQHLNERVKEYVNELESADTSAFSKDAQIDLTVVLQLLKNLVREQEKMEPHRKNPNSYLDEVMGGVFLLIMKDFAPLEERLTSVLGRTRAVPRVLTEAQKNLQPERVPPSWANLALDQAKLAPGLFQGMLPAISEPYPELHEELVAAGADASRALVQFAEYLEHEVVPVARGNFAVGPDLFNQLLAEDHMVDYDADELLETGWRLFKDTREQMESVAREIDPDMAARDLLEKAKENHPDAGELLATYRRVMEETRQFVIEHDVVTIPEGESLSIIETPPYLRAIIPYAAYMQPGIFDDDLEGLFLVTPVDPDSPAEEQEEKLKGHHLAKLPVTTLHEGYPGHHLQLAWSVTHGTVARKFGMALSTLFVEGWAFYCEELMEDLGYINTPVQRLGRLSDQLWRAGRIILDVSLHCKGMSVEEAVDFLVDECQHERSNALAEVRRYTMSPTQPQSYLMGKLEILDIVDEYKKHYPEASLKELHDEILACGSLPPRLMRKALFE